MQYFLIIELIDASSMYLEIAFTSLYRNSLQHKFNLRGGRKPNAALSRAPKARRIEGFVMLAAPPHGQWS